MASGLFTLKQQVQALRQGAWSGQKPKAVDYLVVAGGGGAGTYCGGGGGGGLLTGIVPVITGTSYTVTVGGGGAGTSTASGGQGVGSVFGDIITTGGGAGAYPAGSGGSGGGAGQAIGPTANYAGGPNVSGQGNAGGSYSYDGAGTANYVGGGGGGGAGNVGFDGRKLKGGDGGSGVSSVISGTTTAYAGGGGGCGYSGGGPVAAGVGGAGGGGNGGYDTPTAGATNKGGGGGGGAPGAAGAAGGSGIVFVSYPDTYAAASAAPNATISTSGSGSMSCNGSAQNIKYAGSTSLSFGTGDLTIEFWANKSADGSSGYDTVFEAQISGGYAWILELSTSRGFYFGVNSVGVEAVSGATMNDSVWHHWAICRSGSTWYMFKDGVALTKTTDTVGSGNILASGDVYIGSSAGSYPFNGYLSNVRVLKGTALYTSNFTPSTAPLTPITNTQLLMNTVSGSFLADSSVNGFAPSGTSSPTWSSSSPFATGLGYKNRVYSWTTSGSITF
jgi:hypothetical protein